MRDVSHKFLSLPDIANILCGHVKIGRDNFGHAISDLIFDEEPRRWCGRGLSRCRLRRCLFKIKLKDIDYI